MDPSNNQAPVPPNQPRENTPEMGLPPVQPSIAPPTGSPATEQTPLEVTPEVQPSTQSQIEPVQAQFIDESSPSAVESVTETTDEQTYEASDNPPVLQEPISWQASESVHQSKNASWYMGLIVAGVIMILIAIFLLKLWSFAVLIVIMIGSVIFLSIHPPRQMLYQLDNSGLLVNEKQYSFADFRSFSVIQDGSFEYLRIIHVKKFMPPIDVYFPPERGEEIVGVLGAYIPLKIKTPDVIDRLTKRLRL